MAKSLREIVPIKEDWKRAAGGLALSSGVGAALGASTIGGAPIGAPAGAALGAIGYLATRGKKDWNTDKNVPFWKNSPDEDPNMKKAKRDLGFKNKTLKPA